MDQTNIVTQNNVGFGLGEGGEQRFLLTHNTPGSASYRNNQNQHTMSQTSLSKFPAVSNRGNKLALAPKIKGGAMTKKKRVTDFPVASELRI